MSIPKTVKFKWKVLGHEKQKGFLESAIRNNRAAHAYLLAGPAHVGKTSLANDFAKILFCQDLKVKPCGACISCKQSKKLVADLEIIDQDETIKIEQIRHLRRAFSFKSVYHTKKIGIIANAQLLNPEAANALLKFLEEPLGDVILILTCIQPATLPETVVSRTQTIYFAPFTPSELERLLATLSAPARERQAVLKLSAGRPGIAVRLLEDPAFFQAWKDYKKQLSLLMKASIHERLQLTNDLFDREPQELSLMLSEWLGDLEDSLSGSKNTEQLFTTARACGATLESFWLLAQNVNRRLLLDNLALKL